MQVPPTSPRVVAAKKATHNHANLAVAPERVLTNEKCQVLALKQTCAGILSYDPQRTLVEFLRTGLTYGLPACPTEDGLFAENTIACRAIIAGSSPKGSR